TDGDYAIFPQPKLITKSLVNRWNAFATAEKLDERSVAYDLAEQVFVADYDLKMQKFALEGTSIQAFRGGYTLAFKGNLMSRKIMCMLGEFAQYSGIGIKTALGMGATKTNLIKW
ncbi:MAG: CRISPR system precrRNA processing endoribonuclease RAMP protein Cas6, partial [Phascolarctobacterium sp.]|nr:CRISPR system precrRNA processing endoribonuclease RAMP protein Cas6 [Phascolarctobacterium sp.]